jgi:hypothetical protein
VPDIQQVWLYLNSIIILVIVCGLLASLVFISIDVFDILLRSFVYHRYTPNHPRVALCALDTIAAAFMLGLIDPPEYRQ